MNITKKKPIHKHREPISDYQWGEVSGEVQDRGRGLTGTIIEQLLNIKQATRIYYAIKGYS